MASASSAASLSVSVLDYATNLTRQDLASKPIALLVIGDLGTRGQPDKLHLVNGTQFEKHVPEIGVSGGLICLCPPTILPPPPCPALAHSVREIAVRIVEYNLAGRLQRP